MQTEIESAGPFEKVLTVHLGEDDLEQAKERAARKLSRNLRIKGFRPGKAPRRIVEAHVGSETLRKEAIEEALPSVVGEALAEAELRPATAPRLQDIRDVDEGVEVEVRVTLWPTLKEIPSYEGREIRLERPGVTAEEVDRQVDRLREQFAELEVVPRKAEEGDYVSIDLSASHHGRPVEEASAKDLLYEVGSRSFLPGLDEHLGGAGAGDILRFNARLPEGFTELGGQEVTFQVLVKDVRRKKLPQVTDEWVAEVSEFQSAEELRGQLAERLEELKKEHLRRQFESRLLEELIAEMDLVVPEALVGSEMERMLRNLLHRLEARGQGLTDYLQATGQTQEAFLSELRREAERNLKTQILLDSVAEREGLEVSSEEVDQLVESLARVAGDDAEAYRRALRQGDGEDVLASDILRHKAADILLESAVAVDEKGERIDLQDVAPPADTGGGASPETDEVEETREEG